MKSPASSRRPTNISNMIFNFLREKAGEHAPPLNIAKNPKLRIPLFRLLQRYSRLGFPHCEFLTCVNAQALYKILRDYDAAPLADTYRFDLLGFPCPAPAY